MGIQLVFSLQAHPLFKQTKETDDDFDAVAGFLFE
jgi:hypothetical protein